MMGIVFLKFQGERKRISGAMGRPISRGDQARNRQCDPSVTHASGDSILPK